MLISTHKRPITNPSKPTRRSDLDSVIGLFPVARGAAHFDFPKAATRPAAITTASRLLTRIPAAHPRVAVPTATGGNFGGVGVASDSNFKDIYTNLQYRFNLERDKESRNAIQAAGPTGPRDHTYLNVGSYWLYGRALSFDASQQVVQKQKEK